MSDLSTSGKLRALSASLRLPNLPSVWSNTLTGVIFACLIQEHDRISFMPLALISASSLYFAGNLLNDFADRQWDCKHRPERALPSGLFKPKQYLALAITLLMIGLISAGLASLAALGISICITLAILLYTWCHKQTAWSVIPMASCRALLPILGYAACAEHWHRPMWAFLPAALLFIYLILLSLRARSESRPSQATGSGATSAIAFLLPPVMVALLWYFPHRWTLAVLVCLLSSIPYLIWLGLTLTVFRKPIPRQISALLAGIPLIDSLFLLPYIIMGFVWMPDLGLQILAMAWLPCFVAGRLLQRYVPAT